MMSDKKKVNQIFLITTFAVILGFYVVTQPPSIASLFFGWWGAMLVIVLCFFHVTKDNRTIMIDMNGMYSYKVSSYFIDMIPFIDAMVNQMELNHQEKGLSHKEMPINVLIELFEKQREKFRQRQLSIIDDEWLEEVHMANYLYMIYRKNNIDRFED